jgi:hypothetical protein
VDEARGVGAGDDPPAELVHLLDRVDRDVPGAGDDHVLALERGAAGTQHLLDEVCAPVPGGLAPHLSAAVDQPLAGEHTRLVPVGDALVLPEQVADLARPDPDVAGRDVGVLADVPGELGHEALAEPHDLPVGAALRVEVGPALAPADRQPGQRVLEHLLEAEELDRAEQHRRVEAQPALVGPERAVELHPEPAVDVDLAAVVLPRDPEDDLSLGLADPFDDLRVGVGRMLVDRGPDALQHLPYGLVELGLAGVAREHIVVDALEVDVHVVLPPEDYIVPLMLSRAGSERRPERAFSRRDPARSLRSRAQRSRSTVCSPLTLVLKVLAGCRRVC